jgi:excisionase family DNA binding protein
MENSDRWLSELLTAKELEALLKIDIKTIYRYVQRGLIPYVRIQSNVRFVKKQIAEWIEKQSHRPDMNPSSYRFWQSNQRWRPGDP